MKPLQPFRIVTRKILQKIQFSSFNRSRGPFDRSNTLFDWLNRNRIAIETSRNFKIIFRTISIDRAKVLTDWKYWFSNFHLENFRTWIFTLWNHILQTQKSLLYPILVYTYIYNTAQHQRSTTEIGPWPQINHNSSNMNFPISSPTYKDPVSHRRCIACELVLDVVIGESTFWLLSSED